MVNDYSNNKSIGMEQHRHLSEWVGGFFGGGVGVYHFIQVQANYSVDKFFIGLITAILFGAAGALGGHWMHKFIFWLKHKNK